MQWIGWFSRSAYRKGPLAVLAMLLMLCTWDLVAGQGLDVAGEQLGAGAAATASEFELFEDALMLSSVGGRGQGGRGGSGNLGGFRDVTDYEQLQASFYYIGSSPRTYVSSDTTVTPGNKSYVPEPADQKLCNTCVGQAVATAVQMSLAYTLQQDVASISVSPLNLYYCSGGGRACLTGWDIQPALAQMEQNAWLLRPKACIDSVIDRNEAEVNGWNEICSKAAGNSGNAFCNGITKDYPLYKCTYKSLSSFYQIQQHIRKHGAVVTRVAVPDDFNIQFNFTKRGISGLDLPPYQYNVSAKTLYGHAALIVGYNNENFTWTLLNSWGRGNASDQSRFNGGVTADGMFKVKMGLLGVGTPEKSYGVACEPAVGRTDNLNGEQPWLKTKRLPVAEISANNRTCFNYSTRKGDSISSLVDHFDLDIRKFVQQNKENRIGKLANLTYRFSSATFIRAEEISSVLRIATNATKDVREPEFRPYVTCWHYNAEGGVTEVTCNSLTDDGNKPCAASGTVGCTLHYQDLNVTETLEPNTTVQVCNGDWKTFSEFNRVAYVSDSVRFKGLNIPEKDAVVLQRLCEAFTKFGSTATCDLRGLNCTLRKGEVTYANMTTEKYTLEWGVYCGNGAHYTTGQPSSVVAGIYIGYQQGDDAQNFASYLPPLTEEIGHMLLSLENLTSIYIAVNNGTLPPQLGALPRLRHLAIDTFCMSGGLPPGWITGMTSLQTLQVIPAWEARNFVDPEGGTCGVQGPIPQSWFTNNSSIEFLDLSGNKLSGELPVQIGQRWKSLQVLMLRGNRFAGEVPRSWSTLSDLTQVDLGENLLTGVFPLSWSSLQQKLAYLSVNTNSELQGCAPLTSYTRFYYNGTRMTGLCRSDADDVASVQRTALVDRLPKLLCTARMNSSSYTEAYEAMVKQINNLGKLVGESQTTASLWVSRAGGFSARLIIEVIDGAEYVTSLEFYEIAVDMQQLAPLLKELPKIRTFICQGCNKASWLRQNSLKRSLPQDLPAAAPGLKLLWISFSGLSGKLPTTWGKWQSIEAIYLSINSLTNALPKEWRGMSSLKVLDVGYNKITGKLPTAWGDPGTQLQSDLAMYVNNNPRLHGTVPRSFAHFSNGLIDIRGTSMDQSCSPGGMTVMINGNTSVAKQCFGNSTDVQALAALKQLLMVNNTCCETWNVSDVGSAGPSTPPKYCRWKGVGCDTSYFVSKLDLSVLGLKNATPLNLNDLLMRIEAFRELNTLVLAGVNATGVINGSIPTHVLGSFKKLLHLDIANNPGITGDLPQYISTLTALQVLNISGTGVSGGLPPQYGRLQELREFRAANCTQLEGQLPVEYGLLSKLEVFEISGSRITGPLPQEWANPAALGALTPRLLDEAKQAASIAEKQLKEVQLLLNNPVVEQAPQEAPEVGAAGVTTNSDATVVSAARTVWKQAVTDYKAAEQAATGAARAVQALQKTMAVKPDAPLGLFNLKKLIISGNRGFTSPLPGIYSDLGKLEYVDLSANNITGNLPGEWAELKQLQVLKLGNNHLDGPHPTLWYGLTNLRALYLNDNSLEDAFPDAYWSMRQLAILDIRRSSPPAATTVWETFAGNGYSIQCLLLDPRLTEPEYLSLKKLAWAKNPPGDIEFTDANKKLCMLDSVLGE